MNATLLGKNRVSESEVINVPDVPFTRTFHPVHHRDVIRVVREGVEAVGMQVIRSEYVIAAEGKKMFTVWDLSHRNSTLCWALGIRNSMDKSMSLGICGGTRIFVCENLSFSGEFIAFRRHTSGLDIDELSFLAYRAVRKMVPILQSFQAWHEGLKNYPLSDTDLKVLTVEIMTNNIIPPSKFNQFHNLLNKVYDDGSLWSWHEAVTDTLRDSNLIVLPQKNKRLNGIINDFLDSHDERSTALGDFYELRASYR